MTLVADKAVRIVTDEEELCASLMLHVAAPNVSLNASDLIGELEGLGLRLEAEGREAVEQFCKSIAEGITPEAVVVARGVAPVSDTPGRLEKLYEPTPDSETVTIGSFSHYDHSSIVTVREGQPLLKIYPPVEGCDGVTAFGKPIPRKLAREVRMRPGRYVEQRGDTFYAVCGGELTLTDQKIWVSPELQINGDVDFRTGNIEFEGNITVGRNVLDLFRIDSDDSVTVHGIIEAAEIHVGRDLLAGGGIAGKEKGRFVAGRHVEAKYITNATVRAGGDILVHKEIVNSDLVCGGRLILKNGAFVGGQLHALGGAHVKELGSGGGVKTTVVAGVDYDFMERFRTDQAEIERLTAKAIKLKKTVEPLLANRRWLTPDQKEQAGQLLMKARELDERMTRLRKELREAYIKSLDKSTPEIHLNHIAWTEVMLRFPRVQTTLRKNLKGPVRIKPQLINRCWQVVAVHDDTGWLQNLGGQGSDLQIYEELDKLVKPDR